MAERRIDIGEKLKRLAADRKIGLTVNQLRVVVALERAVARLESEPLLRDHLVFKGGFVLLKLINSSRFTRDLDALAFDLDQAKVAELAARALTHDVGDGVWFLDSRVEELRDQGEYGGLRMNVAFQIGTSRPEPSKIRKLSRIHVDIGFGDVLPDKAWKSVVEMSSVLGSDPVSWRVYPLEFIFGEKLQTLVARGSANSRAKDVYDLVEIYGRCRYEAKLVTAVSQVFENRNTTIPESLADHFKRLDLAILSAAWGSVDVPGNPRFEDRWRSLLEILAKLDVVLQKN